MVTFSFPQFRAPRASADNSSWGPQYSSGSFAKRQCMEMKDVYPLVDQRMSLTFSMARLYWTMPWVPDTLRYGIIFLSFTSVIDPNLLTLIVSDPPPPFLRLLLQSLTSQMVKFLLDRGVPVNLSGRLGATAAHVAAKSGNVCSALFIMRDCHKSVDPPPPPRLQW